jgi:hypothetical protein
MSDIKTVTETVTRSNPLEEVFDIPSGSTEMTVVKPVTESLPIELYDEKDVEIEKQFDTVKDIAQYTFDKIQEDILDVEPKYTARLQEVASGYLGTMLDAIKSKAKLKMEKDKIAVKKTNGGSTKINQTTNNTIISTTTDVIESIRNGKLSAIDGEFTVKQENIDDER